MAAEAPVKPEVDKATRDEIDDAGRCTCRYPKERDCRVRCTNEMTGEDRMCTTCRRLIAGELPPDGHCHAMIAGMG